MASHAAARNGGARRDQRPLKKRLADASAPYLYSAPALILIVTVMLVPLVLGISYAFRDIQLLNPMSGGFIGLDHFRTLSEDQNFYRALKNLALLLDKPFRGRKAVQALVFLPWAVPSFLSGLTWAWLFNPDRRPVAALAVCLGAEGRADQCPVRSATAMWGPIIANVWFGIPFFAITLLAALKSIPSRTA
jgi:multiple sugar transport system permease protein